MPEGPGRVGGDLLSTHSRYSSSSCFSGNHRFLGYVPWDKNGRKKLLLVCGLKGSMGYWWKPIIYWSLSTVLGIKAVLVLIFLPEWALLWNRTFFLSGVNKSVNKWGIWSAVADIKVKYYIFKWRKDWTKVSVWHWLWVFKWLCSVRFFESSFFRNGTCMLSELHWCSYCHGIILFHGMWFLE